MKKYRVGRALYGAMIVAITGCAHSVFAPPSVLYSDDDSIGVRYRSAGIQSTDEPGKAMSIIDAHCNGSYGITNRTERDGWTTVDAKCE